MNIEWKVEDPDPPQYDNRGRRIVLIHEIADGYDERVYKVPGVVYQAFIRARRDVVKKHLVSYGYTKKLPEIDWSFLEKGTKQ